MKTGGRGKAGGVKLAADEDEASARAADILGMDIKGHTVRKVLVTEAAEIAEEWYVSFLLDRANRSYLAMASVEGGVEIEQVAKDNPEALAMIRVDALEGCTPEKAREIVAGGEASPRRSTDEVARGPRGAVAGAGRGGRHAGRGQPPGAHRRRTRGRAGRQGHARRERALPARPRTPTWSTSIPTIRSRCARSRSDLNYVKLDGEVGIIGNGAGLVMSTLDVVAYAGEEFGGVRPANFLDIGGGASAEVMSNGLDIVLTDPSVRSVFVNVFGGITSCVEVANGVKQALAMLAEQGKPVDKPLVCRIDGNRAEEGRAILLAAAIPGVELVETMDDAARRAAELAAAGK